ncbi:MAG: toll/interleukin-1 receptor domain-containing protein, partial [Lachnospiraceae bacterium]|nr:toll/interleukin-1 receptor domain-containing protein [Lachnospiraceae bacterium]
MNELICKNCGGTLEFEEGQSVAVCDSCGKKQTLPRFRSDNKKNLFARASQLCRANKFDKALNCYEDALKEDAEDPEVHWMLAMCRYGVEYVEESDGTRKPTIHRIQGQSILADEDYKEALKYADDDQKAVYEAEAREIDRIHKAFMDIARNEKPFDVFICYKETDENGKRSQDSALANELYHSLTQDGFKVFFAAITLEDKLGTDYEPYIFAALHSAKVMVVMGTKKEYFEATWVRNEWNRYLSLIESEKEQNHISKRALIPAYKDMDAYDLPEEFAHLQAMDMSKLGFMPDLTRGIRKILDAAKGKPAAQPTQT